MEIRIGSGNYIVVGIEKKGVHGVQIRDLKAHGKECDTNAEEFVERSSVVCSIWFENLRSARMFQDHVNIACLEINGYKVENA